MAEPGIVRCGRAHLLGDGVSLDDGIIPARFASQRVLDPEQLVPHLFENVDSGFSARAQPGDIVLAGHDFASGKPRLQGFIAMAAMNLSIVCTSMPFKMLRRSVARGIPTVTDVAHVAALASTGDSIEIDFATGRFRNLTRGTDTAIAPMPPILLDIVRAGGTATMLRDWLADHPEQGVRAISSL